MMESMTPPEGVAVLCLLTIGADNEVKQEELTSMLTNPFFLEHVTEKIGPHQDFLKRYKHALSVQGPEKLESRAIVAVNEGFTAMKLKTMALMLLIAEADGEYDDAEKALIGRVSQKLSLNPDEAQAELKKMKKAVLAEKQQENAE